MSESSSPTSCCCCCGSGRATRAGIVAFLIIVLGGLFAVALFHYLNRDRIAMETSTLPALDQVTPGAWQNLSQKTIYFGHQSVGFNMFEGLREILPGVAGLDLNLVEIKSADGVSSPALAHGRLGENRRPMSKVEAFQALMDSGLGDQVDMAGLKLCYVDITRESDPEDLFRQYKAAFDALEARYPRVRFYHLTAPLESRPPGVRTNLKIVLRRLTGKPTWVDDNVRRHAYNTRLREAYGDSGRLFDIARIEALDGQGRLRTRVAGGVETPVMCAEYSYDGGHLNGPGRRRVAEQFLIMLARLAQSE